MNAPPSAAVYIGPLVRGISAGHAVVRLPAGSSPVVGLRLFRGRLAAGGRHLETWVDFGLQPGEPACASPEVFRELRVARWTLEDAHVTVLPTSTVTRIGGYLGDIPGSDVVQVDPQLAEHIGAWALAITPHLTGPVRVVSHDATPAGRARFAYALRTLLALEPQDSVLLQPLDEREPGRFRGLHRAGRRAAEGLLGTPPLALRATEGLVGDDGRRVARVSESAFEYLGMSPGDRAHLTWGRRSTTVRLLAQSDDTRTTMEAQLSEMTGRQVRETLSDRASRLTTPPHLRIWVSSSSRNALGAPPDTLVRVRRQLSDQLLRRTSSAAVPAAALIIAGLTVPSIPAWAWVVAAAGITTITALPLRRIG